VIKDRKLEIGNRKFSGIFDYLLIRFQSSNVPEFQCSRVPMFQSSNVPEFQCSMVPMFQGFSVPGFQGFLG